MKYNSAVGRLIFIEGAPNGTGYYFELANGKFLDVKFLCSEEEAADVPRNTRIALSLSEEKIEDFYLVSKDKPFYTVLRENA